MRRTTGAALAAAALVSLPSPPALADAVSDHVYGPPPTWEQYRQIAEADIAGRLIDPESARFTWLSGYVKYGAKTLINGSVVGYFACGRVNARNRMGGYAGAMTFIIVIDYDRVLYAQLDSGAIGTSRTTCEKALSLGRLPAVPVDQASTTSAAGAVGSQASISGLQLRAMPDGAYISAVTPGSPAATAGLKPGMVIASVNAIPLASMGDAMLKVVEAAGGDASLGIVGGSTVKLGSAR